LQQIYFQAAGPRYGFRLPSPDSWIRYRYPERINRLATSPGATENAKNARAGPSGGPTPNRHLRSLRTRPASPRKGSAPITWSPPPVRSVPQTDRWCLRLLTSMQRGC